MLWGCHHYVKVGSLEGQLKKKNCLLAPEVEGEATTLPMVMDPYPLGMERVLGWN